MTMTRTSTSTSPSKRMRTTSTPSATESASFTHPGQASTAAECTALIEAHLPLVRSVARRLRHLAQASTILDYEDLVGYGSVGLIHAVDSFDPTRGVKFATWAVLHIRTTIQDALRMLDPLPRSVRTKGTAMEQAHADLAQRTGTWPTDVAVAAALGMPLAQVRTTQQLLATRVTSLDQVVEGSGADANTPLLTSLADAHPMPDPQVVLEQATTAALLAAALAQLPPREQCLLREHAWQDRTLRDIGTHLGVSESRVSQLRTRALQQLRTLLSDARDVASRPATAA